MGSTGLPWLFIPFAGETHPTFQKPTPRSDKVTLRRNLENHTETRGIPQKVVKPLFDADPTTSAGFLVSPACP